MRRVHLAVLGVYISRIRLKSHPMTTPPCPSSMRQLLTMICALRWFVPETTVVVSSALDGDAVVAGVEDTVLNGTFPACFRVASVSVRSFVPNGYRLP